MIQDFLEHIINQWDLFNPIEREKTEKSLSQIFWEVLENLFGFSTSSQPLNGRAITPIEVEFYSILEKNLDQQCDFDDYREPNEDNPENIQSHLDLAEPGIHVCTGSERLFFHLLLCDEKKCQGIIGRDINPKIAMYVAFNTLLLRIADNRQEYVDLSTPISECDFSTGSRRRLKKQERRDKLNERLKRISSKIDQDKVMPENMKRFYQKHLNAAGKAYLYCAQYWRTEQSFEKLNYTKNDEQFLKLQRFARSGKIISTVGNINDLGFLKEKEISVVDTSNIVDYTILDFQGSPNNFRARVIHTVVGMCKTNYYSYIYLPLSSKEKKEFEDLAEKIRAGNQLFSRLWMRVHLGGPMRLSSDQDHPSIYEMSPGADKSKHTLQVFKRYVLTKLRDLG